MTLHSEDLAVCNQVQPMKVITRMPAHVWLTCSCAETKSGPFFVPAQQQVSRIWAGISEHYCTCDWIFSISSDFNILKFPDEILIEIILYLNARDRIPLGYACTKFNSLVFNDKRFYRNLDFSEKGYLTSLSDVRQYLKKESMRTHVRKINLGNMYCPSPEPMLTNIIMAKNLVELNIIGIPFDSLLQLASFLDALESLKKLSISWPEYNNRVHCEHISNSFKRLKHLTVRVRDWMVLSSCIPLVSQHCQELEELRVLAVNKGMPLSEVYTDDNFIDNFAVLSKLKIIAGYDIYRLNVLSDRIFAQIMSNNEQWTEFHPVACAIGATLYYEKNLKMTQEMSDQIQMVNHSANTQNTRGKHGHLFSGYLLAYAVPIATGKKTINSQCSSQHRVPCTSMLKVEDIQLLLQNPGHQISYVHIEHDIESTCNMHLSRFPKLTKLVLCGIINRKESIPNTPDTEGESSNLKHPDAAADSNPAFKKLIEDTLHLKDFTLYPESNYEDKKWDLNTLHLISDWKELTSLFLGNIPITNGKFLIEIGKHCENLEKLRLADLGPRSNCCYKNDLSQMLTYCRNLKDFAIEQNNLGQVSEIFTMFTGNSRLQRLCIKSLGENNTFDNLVSPVEGLILSCNLILLVCEFEGIDNAVCDELHSTVERLKDVLNRPSFEFEVFEWLDDSYDYVPRNDTLQFAHKDLLLPHNAVDALYQLGC